MSLISISKLYKEHSLHPELEALRTATPQIGAGTLLSHHDMKFLTEVPSLINIAASFLVWWRNKARTLSGLLISGKIA